MKQLAYMSLFLALFFGCKTTLDLPDTLTAEQLIQKGQDAYTRGRYKQARQCYTAVVARFGMDTNKYIEARYELGHLALKERQYQTAYDIFNDILDLYAQADPGVIKPAFKKLCAIDLARIPEDKMAAIVKRASPPATQIE